MQSAVGAIHLVLIFLGIPFQIILLLTLWRFRKKATFKCSFFKLLGSLTINDLLFCTLHQPIGIWHFLGGYRTHPYLMATLTQVLVNPAYMSSVVGLAAIAGNRFINLVFYTRAHALWTERTTKVAIGVQWGIGLLTASIFIHPDTRIVYVDQYTFTVVAPNSSAMAFVAVWGVVIMGASTALIVLCYTACIIALLHHRFTNSAAGGDSFAVEIKLFVQGLILSLCLIGGLTTYVIFLSACTANICSEGHQVFGLAVFFGNFYTTAPLAIAISTDLRKHAKMIVKKKNKVNIAKTNGNNETLKNDP